MKIIVTGGSGFVGEHLVRRLAADGHTVLALARSVASADKVRTLGATPLPGDLDSPDELDLPAVDAVVHAAAYFRFAGPRAAYFRSNVAGTRVLLNAAKRAGATTFVYMSAAGVVMDDHGAPMQAVNESARTYPKSFSGYIATKSISESEVLAANTTGFRTIALRPSAIWGPGDSFSREIPGRIETGQFAFINRGDYPFSTCHVDNVVEAVQLALVGDPGGRAYFVNDREPITFRQFIAGLADAQDLSIDNLRSVPYYAAVSLGWIMERIAFLRPGQTDPPLTRTMVRMIGREFTTDDRAARAELGYVGRTSRAEGLKQLRTAP
ncbi:MAG: NAD(P)-dependent oxidoreductase [Mycolicibacterium sp.]|uniref:NAD-dependent epimerase/dehydratase family protein n=1 Tax=Mycolicibacterium sp. TaxID=2320850 RepID=UPI000F94531D|nr:NAD(P)-dependent oxidoreductase [Mycolicibacterium sp.]RUP26877.1 MAG: NAD(P)-dependent oxidoreductase [Mycolicibacterium sp.]